jgi:hypothetical protein
MAHEKRKDRIYNNTEIQELIVSIAKKFNKEELDKYCRADYSKIKFDINYPLFVKASKDSSESVLNEIIKDHNSQSRWTWKYKFQIDNYIYAITTQWYDRNDEYVKRWVSSYISL